MICNYAQYLIVLKSQFSREKDNVVVSRVFRRTILQREIMVIDSHLLIGINFAEGNTYYNTIIVLCLRIDVNNFRSVT